MGGNGAVVIQILGVLGILFFFFLTFMFTRTWRWHHVLFAFAIFPAAITLLVFATMTIKTHTAWKQIHAQREAELDKLTAEIAVLRYGDPNAAGGAIRSVVSLESELIRTVVDRGRVWRNVQPVGVQNGQIQIDTSNATRSDPAAAPNPNLLNPQDTLFAFTEVSWSNVTGIPEHQDILVPDVYLGEFRIVSATDTEVVIAPVVPSPEEFANDPVRVQAMNQGGGTWALYELMPHDDHYAFAAGAAPDNDHHFGNEPGMEARLRKLFRNRYNLPPDVHEGIIQRYLRDGGKLQPDDPPSTRWARVEFLEAHQVQVDVKAPLGVLEQDYFDASGRAEDSTLWISPTGDPNSVSFKKGDIGFFPEEHALDLVANKMVKIEANVFARELADYDYIFRTHQQRIRQLKQDIYFADRESKLVEATTASTVATEQMKADERDKLAKDKGQLELERDAVVSYRDELTRHLADVHKRANYMYRMNREMEAQLQEVNRRLTEEINRRSAEAAAASARKPDSPGVPASR